MLRYFLLREIPFGQDGAFSFDALVARYNADLANGYGNLVSRTLNMIQQNFDGVVPESGLTTELTSATTSAITAVESALEHQHFTAAVQACSALITATDGYISENAPWKLAKDPGERDRLATVLRTAAKSIRIVTALLYPVLPYTTERVWQQLGLGSLRRAVENGELTNLTHGGFGPNARLGRIHPLFPRADKDTLTRMTDTEQKPAPLATETDPQTQRLAPMTEATPDTPASSAAAEASPSAEAGLLRSRSRCGSRPCCGTGTGEARHAADHHRRLRKGRPACRPRPCRRAHSQGRQASSP